MAGSDSSLTEKKCLHPTQFENKTFSENVASGIRKMLQLFGCLIGNCCNENNENCFFWVNPILFGKIEAEMALKDSSIGTYLMYRDYETDHLYLSIRTEDSLRHHWITQRDGLYYLDKQPYPYLDSIILYHKKHKLRGIKLTQQAPLSARVVKSFASRFAANNGNLPASKDVQDKNFQLEEALSRL